MRFLKVCAPVLLLTLFACFGNVQAKVDVAELYANAVMTADIPQLEKILAPNFWYIAANGHIRDKEHFIQEVKNKDLVVNRLIFTNERETKIGETTLYTANGEYRGTSKLPRPQGPMRYTLVITKNHGQDQVVLFQATPVIPTADCKDGNCAIK